METPGFDFETTLQRARDGCPNAESQLIELCSNDIRNEIHRRLDHRLRSLLDVEDLVQDVWMLFFQSLLRQRSFHIHSIEQLRGFLQNVARNVVCHVHRRYRRELAQTASPGKESQEQAPRLSGTEDDPFLVALAHDEWEVILHGRSSSVRVVLERLHDGETAKEIACILDISVRTTQRLIQRTHGVVDRFLSAQGESCKANQDEQPRREVDL